VDGVNSYFVSAAARQGVTVAISGTGGDELFAGYPWFISMDVASAKDRQHTLRTAVRTLLAHTARQPFFDPLLISKLGPAIDKMRSLSGFLSVYARIYQIFGAARGARMLSPAMRQMTKVGQELALDLVLADELHAEPTLERVSALCLRGYTQNQLLRDIDAVSMSHSLEVRVPFLDPKLTDLALSLPLWAKLNDVSKLSNPLASTYRETGVKKILVDVGRGLLPDGLDLQVKRGFGMPFDSWLKGSLRDVFDDVMSPATLNRRGFFDTEEALSLKKNFLAGKQGWARPWLLMMIELWCREVFDKSSLPHGDHRKAT
jgi:asparagine synthase (glutamine-hydrolysing)